MGKDVFSLSGYRSTVLQRKGEFMFFYITDDDEVFRSMLSQIIEDEELGDVLGNQMMVLA